MNQEQIAIGGWLIDCISSLIPFVLIGFLISLKFKSKRIIIITVSVILALISPTVTLFKNLQQYKSVETESTIENNQANTTSTYTPPKSTYDDFVYGEGKTAIQPKPDDQETKQARFSTTELQNLFDKVINDSDGGVLNIGYVQQGDTIEVDVQIREEGWNLLDDSSKHGIVSQLGKGFQLAIEQSTLYSEGKNVYVYFTGDVNHNEIANYDHEEVSIVQ